MFRPVERGEGAEGQGCSREQHFLAQQQGEADFALQNHEQEQHRTRREKRSPAEKKGGAPASTPILMARKVVPKIRQTSE